MKENKEIIPPLFTLPAEIIELISSYLDAKELFRMSLAYNKNNFFCEPLKKTKNKLITQLLQFVAFGEQDKAEELLQKYPKLTLVSYDVTDYSGRTFEDITAFQYSLWALDEHMWTMLLKYLSTEEAIKQLESHLYAEKKYKKLHGLHYDFTLLIDALHAYVDHPDSWSDDQKLKHWCEEVGRQQRLVPAHVANEYCLKNRSFDPKPEFNQENLPQRSLTFCNFDTQTDQLWFPLIDGKGLGYDLAVHRDNSNIAYHCSTFVKLLGGLDKCMVYLDLVAVTDLRDVRTKNFMELEEKLCTISPKKQKLDSTPSEKSLSFT